MQQEENYLAQSISQVDADARYDEGVKRLLANKKHSGRYYEGVRSGISRLYGARLRRSISKVNRRLALSAWMPMKPTVISRLQSTVRTRKM